jgi:hypothetical protein
MNREEAMKKMVEESVQARRKILEARKPKFQRFDSPTIPGVEANYGGAVSSGGGIAPIEPTDPFSTFSMYFDNGTAGNSVVVGGGGSLNITDNLSISVWVKPDSTLAPGGPYGIIDKAPGSGNSGYSITHHTGDGWRFTVGNGASTVANFVVPNTDWQHLVGTYDSGTGNVLLYHNGLLVDTKNTGGGALTNSGNDLSIGAGHTSGTSEFAGFIDEAAIWNTTLSVVEIQAIYNLGCPDDLASKYVGEVGWWRMGEDATFLGGTWTIPNMFNPGTNDGTSTTLPETDRRTVVPC